MTIVSIHHNPFTSTRDYERYELSNGLSIDELVPFTHKPIICYYNGQILLRKDWTIETKESDIINFVVLPQGGGGSNPLRIILTLAIMIVAPELGVLIAGEGIMGTIAAAAIGFVGAALVNVLIPAKTALSNASNIQSESASPTYSVAAQGNSARIGEAIPVHYGQHIAYPDFAASPYVEYSGNEQYLYELFCVGLGEYVISSIRIEDTPIGNFEEVSTQVINPGEKLTLFPASVETSGEVSGQEMETNVPLGPFVANTAGTTANRLAVDVVCARGLYYMRDDGGLSEKSITFKVEAREIDDIGEALGDFMEVGRHTITAATSTPQRRSYQYDVSLGRYEVKVTRLDAKDASSRAGHEINWAGLKAYLEDAGNVYDGMTLLAVKIRATNNISEQASRKINVICTRKLAKWSPESGWSEPIATRSIAWAFADACRSKYGAKLPDDRIDLQALYELDRIWTERGDNFDYRFDTKTTVWEALQTIARAGRAKPYKQGGMVRIVRDQKQTVPTGMFTMNNIVKDTFSVQYLMPTEETADAVEIEYYDERIWQWKTVQCKLPDSVAEEPVTVKLLGVTDRKQAWREGMYMAACNRYRRRMIGLTTEMEGFIPTMGDLCIVSHDMPQWGQSSAVRAFDTQTGILTLSEPLTWRTGETHFIVLRRPDGTPFGPVSVMPGTTQNQCVMDPDVRPDFTIRTGKASEPTYCSFGWAETWSQPARCLSLKPNGMNKVEISLVGEDDVVHLADTGDIPGEVIHSQLPGQVVRPEITGLIVRSMPNNVRVAVMSWNPSPWATMYYIEQSADLVTWTRAGQSAAPNFTCSAIYGNATFFRVCAVGTAVGSWVMIAYATGADYMWHANEETMMWDADDSVLMFKN